MGKRCPLVGFKKRLSVVANGGYWKFKSGPKKYRVFIAPPIGKGKLCPVK
jgi:hypothetical protein